MSLLRFFRDHKYGLLATVSLVVIVSDQITKIIVAERFFLGESIPVIPGYFSLTYVRNTGAAFGILAKADPAFRVPFFIIIPIVALFAIATLFRKIPKDDLKLSSALSFVIGGAVGNLIDRLRLGYVIDFFDFHWKYQYHFPAFNIADSMICIGVGILMLDLLFQGPAVQLADSAVDVDTESGGVRVAVDPKVPGTAPTLEQSDSSNKGSDKNASHSS